MDPLHTFAAVGRECLRVQRDLAASAACKMGQRVYLFTPTPYFDTPPFEDIILDGIRLKQKDKKLALLSSAAQTTIKSKAEYRALLNPSKISEDDIGVYINP